MKLSAFQKTYDKVTVLNFPGMNLEKGKIYAVIGANGSGKSTFCKILAGIFPADQRKAGFSPDIAVGYMPQKSYAYRMSVQANIALGGRDAQKMKALMEALQLTHLAKKRANKLSGGETARMALARLLMKSYDVLILDEPTSAMDMETTAIAEEQIRQYVQKTGATVLLVTHSLQQARRLAHEALFFRKGILVEYGSIDIVLYHPKHPETRNFLDFYGG